MTTIKIEPDAVDGTAASFQQGAQSINDAGHSARQKLHHLDGIPKSFHGPAGTLGAEVGRTGYYASDALAVSGLELARRAEIARIVDAQPFAAGAFNPNTPVGARQDLGLWNEATREASKAKPGAYFDAISRALRDVAISGTATAAVVTPGAPKVTGKGASTLVLADKRTGSQVTLEQAVKAADTSGTGVAIAIGKDGRLTIAKAK